MKLPVSFDDVGYFRNEYRGDLIVTDGVLYYFAHTRVAHSRHAPEIGGKEAVDAIGAIGLMLPFFDFVPWIHTAADKSVKVGKLFRRNLRPTTNSPRIGKLDLWKPGQTSQSLQQELDNYIETVKNDPLKFEGDSVPKPMRFAADEMENIRLGLKLQFEAEYDSHDFRISPIHKSKIREALVQGGFLK